MFERDRSVKQRRFEEALEVASATHDNDLAFAALAYLGASLVHADQVTEGMVRLDESLAAVAGGEVEDLFVIEEIFCQMFSACERAHDVARAEQWLRVGEAVAAQRNLPAVVAYCHTHFGGVVTAAGRWPMAGGGFDRCDSHLGSRLAHTQVRCACPPGRSKNPTGSTRGG